jgi:hypothetical protein
MGGVDLSALNRIEAMLGRVDATAGPTFFAQLSRISSELESVGKVSSEASKKAQTAKTQAADAASGIQEIKSLLAGERMDPERLRKMLEDVQARLKATKDAVDLIPKGLDREALERAMGDVVGRLKRVIESEGVPKVPVVMEPPPAPGTRGAAGPGAVVPPAEGTAGGPPIPEINKEDVARMKRNMEEIKSSVELINTMIQEKFTAVQVTETLVGVEGGP